MSDSDLHYVPIEVMCWAMCGRISRHERHHTVREVSVLGNYRQLKKCTQKYPIPIPNTNILFLLKILSH